MLEPLSCELLKGCNSSSQEVSNSTAAFARTLFTNIVSFISVCYNVRNTLSDNYRVAESAGHLCHWFDYGMVDIYFRKSTRRIIRMLVEKGKFLLYSRQMTVRVFGGVLRLPYSFEFNQIRCQNAYLFKGKLPK